MEVKGNTALKAVEVTKPVLMISEGGKNKTTSNEVQKPKEVKEKEVKAKEVKPKEVVKKEPTLQELKNRATIIHLLDEKHTKLTAKRSSLDTFRIKHESENAQIVVTDANGEEFKSSSPKTIGKLIGFWKEEFDEAITEIEIEIKNQFAA
jgi:hypothetical protein